MSCQNSRSDLRHLQIGQRTATLVIHESHSIRSYHRPKKSFIPRSLMDKTEFKVSKEEAAGERD